MKMIHFLLLTACGSCGLRLFVKLGMKVLQVYCLFLIQLTAYFLRISTTMNSALVVKMYLTLIEAM